MPLNEHFRKTWKAAGYLRGHGSDAVLPAPGVGVKRLYYLTSSEHAISNIVFSRIKIARFSDCNDPFELLGRLTDRNKLRKFKEEYDKYNGIICFSEDWVDPVLWSHYASKHKGIALGFDIDESLVKKVRYSEQRLEKEHNTSTSKLTDDFVDALIFTKFESWSYEKEWRMLLPLRSGQQEGSLYFKPMDSKLRLIEVILGSNCSLSLSKMRDLVSAHHPKAITYKARLAKKSFRIIPQGTTVPRHWK